MSVEAILFDMDGVLVDSVRYRSEARRRMLRDELDIDGFDVTELVGINARDEHRLLSSQYDLDLTVDEYHDLATEYGESIYREDVALLPGVRELIREAQDRSIALGVVSASFHRRIEIVLDRFELDDAFDVTLASDVIDGPSKPEPDLYRTALDVVDVDPADAIAVEDSVHGVTAAKRAGLWCLRYEHDHADGETEADEVVTAPAALMDRLLALCRSDGR